MPIDLSVFNAYWTFDASSGIVADGPSRPFNNTTPPTSPNFAVITDLGTIQQQFTVTGAGAHTIAVQSENRWTPAPSMQVRVLVDGASIGTIASNDGFHWSSNSLTTGSLAAGTHTLRFEGTGVAGQGRSIFLDSVTITGPSGAVPLLNPSFDTYLLAPDHFVFNPPAVAVPSLRLSVATVSTCGKWLECQLTNITGGAIVAPATMNQAPILSVNGVAAGPLQMPTGTPRFPMLLTSAHTTFLAPVPSAVIGILGISSGAAITLDAPEGWVFGPAGYAEAMAGQAVLNRAGQSFVRLTDVPRTMALGASYYLMAEWHCGFLPKNLRTRCAYWQPPNASEDPGGKPLVMGGTSAVAPVVAVGSSSNIDSTSYPTPAGYWAVRWDDLDGGTTFALTNNGAVNTSCVEVPALGNPGSGGLGKVRVFDFEPTGVIDSSTNQLLTNLYVWLQLSKADKAPHFDNLAVLSPGNFSWTAGQPTTIPMPLWSDVAAEVDAQLPPSLPFGPHRQATAGIQLGNSASCEREDLVDPADFHWAQDAKRVIQCRYVQARPWTNATSPYIYDPLSGTDYPATLTAPITTAPASGTVETITLSQVGDGLILAGLVLTIDSEKMRVMANPTGPSTGMTVSVMRGVASTTPALHPISPPTPKTITVSARRPVADLTVFGPNNLQITELVTQSPHGARTGQILPMDGNGWVNFTYSDGTGFATMTPADGQYHGFSPYKMAIYVTGASSFLVIQPSPNPATVPNVTLSTSYALIPGPATFDCSSTKFLPEDGWVPYEIAASTAARHPGVPARVTFCMAASDDMVDAIWTRVLAYLPPDRDVYAEKGDEPWNFAGVPSFYWYAQSYMLYGQHSPYHWYGVRVGQIRARGRAIWAAAGRDPAHVKSTFNLQCAPNNWNLIPGLLDFFKTHSAVPDLIEVAPYYDYYLDPAVWQAYASWPTDMLVDAWIWDVYRNTSGGGGAKWAGAMLHRTSDYKSAIDSWNAANGGAVALGIYEYGPEKPWPVYYGALGAAMDATTTTLPLQSATAYNPLDDNWADANKVQPGAWLLVDNEWMTVSGPRSGLDVPVNRGQGGTTAAAHASGSQVRNDWIEGVRDLTYHPNYRIAHYDVLAFFQANGVSICIPSSLDQDFPGGSAWADYHGIGQQPGMGDGSDGKANNLLCLARRGQANSKPANVSQDFNVSVRGQAMIEFLQGAAPAAPPRTSDMDIRQSTLVSVFVGPVLDISGNAVTGAVVADFSTTSGGTSAPLASPATASHAGNGHYDIALPAALTSTLGGLYVWVNNAAYAMTIGRFLVIDPKSYDERVTGNLATPRTLDGIPATQITVSDARWGSVNNAAGKLARSGPSGENASLLTPSGDAVYRNFVLSVTTGGAMSRA